MDWYCNLLSLVRDTCKVRWFHWLISGLQAIPVETHFALALSQMSHSLPPPVRHSWPQVKPMLLKNWFTSNSSAWAACRLLPQKYTSYVNVCSVGTIV